MPPAPGRGLPKPDQTPQHRAFHAIGQPVRGPDWQPLSPACRMSSASRSTRSSRPARLDPQALSAWITLAALQRPGDLAAALAERTGASRRNALQALRRLVALQWLVNDGTARRPRHRPGLLRQVVQRYPIAGLSEDLAWKRDFAPAFDLSPTLHRLARHACTELINNAIDHSGGTSVTVSMRQTPSHLQLLVSDDGCGLFDKLQSAFGLDDPAIAMLELGKGKLTSQPDRHTGRGLFFTAQVADVLDLHANDCGFQHRGWDRGGWSPGRALKRRGTSVFAAFGLDTQRELTDAMQSHSASGTDYGFERTAVSLRLMADASEGMESRAQARRVAARLEQFKRATIDFDGVAHIGHSFADELFRVWPQQHPGLNLWPVNMGRDVAATIGAVGAVSPLTQARAS